MPCRVQQAVIQLFGASGIDYPKDELAVLPKVPVKNSRETFLDLALDDQLCEDLASFHWLMELGICGCSNKVPTRIASEGQI